MKGNQAGGHQYIEMHMMKSYLTENFALHGEDIVLAIKVIETKNKI